MRAKFSNPAHLREWTASCKGADNLLRDNCPTCCVSNSSTFSTVTLGQGHGSVPDTLPSCERSSHATPIGCSPVRRKSARLIWRRWILIHTSAPKVKRESILASLLVSAYVLPAASVPSYEPSKDELDFATGMAHGCIDAQRRLHADHGLSFNQETARNICYCMAGRLTERFRDGDFKARADAREATAVAAVNAIESTCNESVRAGRRFAP